MRTDRAVTRSSSERVATCPIVDGQTPVKRLPSLAVGINQIGPRSGTVHKNTLTR